MEDELKVYHPITLGVEVINYNPRADKIVLDIQEPKNSFKDLRANEKEFNNKLHSLTVAYSLMYHGFNMPKNETLFELKNSISYRIGCAIQHFSILLNHFYEERNEIVKHSIKNNDKEDNTGILSLHLCKTTNSILDSIVFHLYSAFDYLGNYVEYTLGKEKKNRKEWSDLISALNHNENKNYKITLKESLKAQHKDFILPLRKYRSRVIHEKEFVGDFLTLVNLTNYSESFVNIYVNKELVQCFYQLREMKKISDITLNYSALWLLKEAVKRMGLILEHIENDFHKHRKIPKHQEHIMYYDSETKQAKSIYDIGFKFIK